MPTETDSSSPTPNVPMPSPAQRQIVPFMNAGIENYSFGLKRPRRRAIAEVPSGGIRQPEPSRAQEMEQVSRKS